MKKSILKSEGFLSFMSSLVSILCGLLIGYILLWVFNPKFANFGLKNLLTAGFPPRKKLAKVPYIKAAPLIMTGLSVGFAFKTGLFNIGAFGASITVGAFCALICGIVFQAALVGLHPGLHWWRCRLGLLPRPVLKPYLNVNEVITSIMFNWIGMFAVNVAFSNIPQALDNYYGASNADRTAGLSAANSLRHNT